MAGSMLVTRQLLAKRQRMSDEPLIVPAYQRPRTEHKGARAPGTRRALLVLPSKYPRKQPKSPPMSERALCAFPPAGDFGWFR